MTLLRLFMRLIVAAIIFVIPAPVWSDTPSAAVLRAIQTATEQAQRGEPSAAMQAMLDLLGVPSDGESDARQALSDRAVISLDRAAAMLRQFGRQREAYGTLMTSRGIRRDAHAPTAMATRSMRSVLPRRLHMNCATPSSP